MLFYRCVCLCVHVYACVCACVHVLRVSIFVCMGAFVSSLRGICCFTGVYVCVACVYMHVCWMCACVCDKRALPHATTGTCQRPK